MRQFFYLRDVVTLELDQEKCNGCGICTAVCPHAVLSLAEGRVQLEQRDACMECGACAKNCPTSALAVRAGVGCAAAVLGSIWRKDEAIVCGCDPATKDPKGSPVTGSGCC